MSNRLPELPADHLPRPRLLEPLLQGNVRLRLLCAPAGSGKSTLLQACARQLAEQGPLCWLDLRGYSEEVEAFRQRLAVALGLDATLPAADLESYLARCETPLRIMLDHLPGGAVEALVGRLLQCSSPQVDWWVACRRRPAWPLARLLMGGELHEVDGRQLALTESELTQLLERHPHRCEAAGELMRRTQGWLAGVKLSLLPHSSTAAVAGFEQLLWNYLDGELLAELQPEQRETLCLLACLPSFDAGLHEALFELDAPVPPLAELLGLGTFIEPAAPGSTHWRVHPAVAPILAQSLPQRRRSWLYRRACQHFGCRRQLPQAVRFALLAEQPEVAASLLQRVDLEAMFGGDGPAPLLWCCEQLPEELRYGSAELVLLQGWALLLMGRLDQAEGCLQRLAAFLLGAAGQDQRELGAHEAVLRGHLLYRRGQAAKAVAMLHEAVQQLPEQAWGERVLTQLLLLEQAQAEGGREVIQALSAAIAQRVRARDSRPLEALLVLQLAEQLERRGELLRAEGQIRRVLAELGTTHALLTGRALLHLGRNLWRQGRLDEARARYTAALQHCTANQDPAAAWAQAGLAELDAVEGRLQQAFDRLGEAARELQLGRVCELLYQPALDLLRGKLWLFQGQHPRSAALAATHLARAREDGGWRLPHTGQELRQQFELLQLRAEVAAGQDRADRLESWLRQARRLGQLGRLGELGFALAEAHLVGGRQRKAQAALFDALAQVRRIGGMGSECFWHSFRPEVARWVGRGEPVGAEAAEAGQLSRREQSVLCMIAEGLANQEIAERLHISLHTVKSHAQRINSKLGVSRRTQAIVRAKALGLVR